MEAAAYLQLICAIVAAKWACDMGYSGFRQLIWGLFAFVLPPLALLILYVRVDRRRLLPDV